MKENIGILMSIYNSDLHPYYKETIDSIKNQRYSEYILYIINDGGKNDETIDYIKTNIRNYKIITNEKNLGLALSLQKGLMIIEEKYVARIDIGDIMSNDRLERQLEYIKKNNLSLIGSYVIAFNKEGEKIKQILPEKHNEILKNIFKKFVLIHPAIFFNKDDIIKVGGYNNKYKTEDLDLYFRLLKNGYKIGNYPDFLTSYIIDDNGITNNSVKEMKKSRAILRCKNLPYFFNMKNLFYTIISLIGYILPLQIYGFLDKIYKKTIFYK